MLPQRLYIKGLYSYQYPTEIEFEGLTQAGIFGIFGPVGSGKSTILEAITFALYGESNRLNARESRGYNMMNLNSNELEVDFTFTHQQNRYRFTVHAKRRKTKFGEVKSPERRAFREEKGDWVPLFSTDATDILGLKYEHFRQIVIIPQGKFQEFVHKSPTERSDMLRELFPLDVYDLSDPLKKLRAQNHTSITMVETQLNELAIANPEEISQVEDQLKAAEEQIAAIQKERSKIELEVREGERLQQLLDQQKGLEEQLETLEGNKEQVDQEEEALKRFEQVRTSFGDLFQRYEKLLEQSGSAQHAEVKAREKLEFAEANWKGLQTRKSLLIGQWGGLEAQKDHLRQLEAAREKIDLQEKLQDTVSQIERTQKEKEAEEHLRQEMESQKEATRKQRDTLNIDLKQLQNLHQLKASFELEDQIRKRLHETREGVEREQNLLKALGDENKKWVKKLTSLDKGFKSWAKLDTSAILKEIDSALEGITDDRARLELQREKGLKKAGLAQYASDLEEGDPCPLCGSTHHPELYRDEAEQEELLLIQSDLKEIQDKYDSLILAQRDGNNWLERQTQRSASLAHQTEVFSRVQEELETCLSNRENAEEMDRKGLQVRLKEAKATEQLIHQLDQSIQALEKQLKEDHSLGALQEQLQGLKVEAARLEEGIIQQGKLVGEDVLAFDRTQLKKRQAELEISRKELESILQQEGVLEAEVQEKQNTLRSASERWTHLNAEVEETNTEIEAQLEKHPSLKDKTAVQAILQQDLRVEAVRERIQIFREELIRCTSALSTIREQMKGQQFKEEEFEQLKAQLKEVEAKWAVTQKRVGELQVRAQDLQEKLKRKKGLASDLKALQLRQENLKSMDGLFRSRGFVQFVSTIYLRQLCALANERFRKLTQNRLVLDLDDKYQFVVKDYLFEGRTRSIKTLSGGQTFQAALCLALALSEQIQGHQGIQQPFFFLDEGFGTLDRDSLALVFETLQQLRQENRTVGIISHVEDLQNEIDHYLKVVNDPEQGSRVEVV